MDTKKDLQRPAEEDQASEQETQHPEGKGAETGTGTETTPMAQTDLEQDEQDDTDPGD